MKEYNVKDSDTISGSCFLQMVKEYKQHDSKRNAYMKQLSEKNRRLSLEIEELRTEIEFLKGPKDSYTWLEESLKKRVKNQREEIARLMSKNELLRKENANLMEQLYKIKP